MSVAILPTVTTELCALDIHQSVNTKREHKSGNQWNLDRHILWVVNMPVGIPQVQPLSYVPLIMTYQFELLIIFHIRLVLYKKGTQIRMET